jgi:hypothetical protein
MRPYAPVRGAVGTFRHLRCCLAVMEMVRTPRALPFACCHVDCHSHASVQHLRPTRAANKICEREHWLRVYQGMACLPCCSGLTRCRRWHCEVCTIETQLCRSPFVTIKVQCTAMQDTIHDHTQNRGSHTQMVHPPGGLLEQTTSKALNRARYSSSTMPC